MGCRCTFHRPTMTFGMRWHPWRGVARLPRFKIAQNKHSLASPHLALASRIHSLGISQGIPHSLSSSPPYPVNHISTLPLSHASPPPSSSFSFGQPFVSSRNTILMGLSPRSAKLQDTLVTTLSISALSILSSLVSLCDQTPPHSSSPGSSTRTAPALPSRPFSCSVILHPNPNVSPCFSL